MGFIAGKYTVTFGPSGSLLPIGQIAAGITLEHAVSKQLITGDNEGQTVQDAVFQGHNVFAEFTMMEYDDDRARDVFWPYGTEGVQGVMGRLDVQLPVAAHLMLTALAGTPAAGATLTDGPQSLTAEKAILAEDFPVRMLFAPALRDIPVRLRLYPYTESSVTKFYVVA